MATITDLELWLIGTPYEVRTALATLATLGRIAGVSTPEPLYGADTGRIRRYARVAVSTAPATTTPGRSPTRSAAGQTVIDLDTRRSA